MYCILSFSCGLGLILHSKMNKKKDLPQVAQLFSVLKQWSFNPDNHDDVIINLEPDILECEVKWALESITMNKANGGDGIPV